QQLQMRLYEYRGKVRGELGEFAGALADLDYVRQSARQVGNTAHEQELTIILGQIFRRADRQDEAYQHLIVGLNNARAKGDQQAVADLAYHLGTVAWDKGENYEAKAWYDEAVEICQALGLQDIHRIQAFHGL